MLTPLTPAASRLLEACERVMPDDSDETEGRKLYRDQANAEARAQVNYARRRVRMVPVFGDVAWDSGKRRESSDG
jgi:hypothetical protein